MPCLSNPHLHQQYASHAYSQTPFRLAPGPSIQPCHTWSYPLPRPTASPLTPSLSAPVHFLTPALGLLLKPMELLLTDPLLPFSSPLNNSRTAAHEVVM